MLLFGLLLFEIYGVQGIIKKSAALFSARSFIFALIVVGAGLSLAHMMFVAHAMSGESDPRELLIHIKDMAGETAVGMSCAIRLAALVIAFIGLAISSKYQAFSRYLLIFSGGTALATLAWGGHAVMNDGTHFYIHLTSDIVHLFAAGAWVGALAAFSFLLCTQNSVSDAWELTGALTAFSRVGTCIVLSIVVTGAVNFLFISEKPLNTLLGSEYGSLLLIKIMLFFLMMILASANRFRFVPGVENALHHGSYQTAIKLIRRSIFMEFILSILIIAIVAWLGTLSANTGM